MNPRSSVNCSGMLRRLTSLIKDPKREGIDLTEFLVGLELFSESKIMEKFKSKPTLP